MIPIYSRRVKRIPLIASGLTRRRVYERRNDPSFKIKSRRLSLDTASLEEEEEEEEEATMTDMIAHARSVGVLNPTLDLFKIPPHGPQHVLVPFCPHQSLYHRDQPRGLSN